MEYCFIINGEKINVTGNCAEEGLKKAKEKADKAANQKPQKNIACAQASAR